MAIDWANFTPISAAIGGVLIGLAAAILLVFNGRIAGISGILGGLLRPIKGDTAWKAAFIIGLMIAPLLFTWFAYTPEVNITASVPVLILAGLFVGFGTRLGGGMYQWPWHLRYVEVFSSLHCCRNYFYACGFCNRSAC